LGCRPVAKQYRDGGEHLHVYLMMIAIPDPGFRIPTIILDLPEELVILHHPGAAWFMMFQMNEAAIAKAFAPTGHFAGHNMGVDVNSHRDVFIR
jgi:hypothetical protein